MLQVLQGCGGRTEGGLREDERGLREDERGLGRMVVEGGGYVFRLYII